MKKIIGIGVMMGASLLLLSGCSSVFPEKTRDETLLVEKDKAEKLEVDINLGVGELIVKKGAKDWVEGTAQYNIKKLAPQVHYNLNGKTGNVEIEHKGSKNIRLGKMKNTWDIELNEDIPMDLSIETGASTAELDLRGLQLENLDIETGVSDLLVDLSGDWKKASKRTLKQALVQLLSFYHQRLG